MRKKEIKTPDEIKKGLAQHATIESSCNPRPYNDPAGNHGECTCYLSSDALAYIQQLEEKCHQLEREKDVLLDSLKKADMYGVCTNCRHRDSAPSDCGGDCIFCGCKCLCGHCVNGDKWEWCGVKEDSDESKPDKSDPGA